MRPMNTGQADRTELRAQGYTCRGGAWTLPANRATGALSNTWVKTLSAGERWWRRSLRERSLNTSLATSNTTPSNDQESGRNSVNITISKRAARESDLLAFEIGVAQGHPAAVMCSYNRVLGDFACENKWLLTDVLKKEWQFPGFRDLRLGRHALDGESIRRPDSTMKSRKGLL